MPDHTLDDAEAAYLAYHQAANHSPQTIEHYRWTFTDLHRFLDATNRPATTASLTTITLQAFHTWLLSSRVVGLV